MRSIRSGAGRRIGYRELLQKNPDDPRVRARIVVAALSAGRRAPGEVEAVLTKTFAEGLTESEASVVAAAAVAGRWRELAGLDERLARVRTAEPLYLDAVTLRIRWRVASGDVENGKHALELADEAYLATRAKRLLILRSRAASQMRDPLAALASLSRIELSGPEGQVAQLTTQYCRRLNEIAPGTEWMRWRKWLMRFCL